MRTFLRPGLPRFKSWRPAKQAAGQWDRVSGVLLGRWGSHEEAIAALDGKRLPRGLGFFADGESLEAVTVAGGLMEVSFSATGLFERKFKSMEGSTEDARTLENVSHPWGAIFPSPTGGALEFREIKRAIDVTCSVDAGFLASDWRNQGKPIAGNSHPVLAAAGVPSFPAVGSNPYTSGHATYHYPYNWYFQIYPQDSVGEGNARLLLCTYRFVHAWPVTL